MPLKENLRNPVSEEMSRSSVRILLSELEVKGGKLESVMTQELIF